MSTTVSYKGSTLTTVSNQQRTLATAGKWMEADLILNDTTPSAPSGTKQISITQNGTTTENVSGYASAQITVNVSGGGTPSQTHHIIHFEFADGTSADINAYWDGSFISDAITATAPAEYGGKTVTEASLDGVTWYEPANIPIGVQLIDFAAVTNDYVVTSDGSLAAEQWYSVSDYTMIDPTMTFEYHGNMWFYLGFYDASKTAISTIYIANDATPSQQDQSIGIGTLTPSKIPANAVYVRITSMANPDTNELSLIRTA